MKKLFVTACIVMLAVTASAQITWNAKIGGGISSCPTDEDAIKVSGRFVGKVGVGIEYPFSANFSLMPSLELAMKGTEWKYEDSSSSYRMENKINLFYLQIPGMDAYRINLSDDWNLTIKAGPYGAFGLFGNIDYSGYDHGESYSGSTTKVFSGSREKARRFDVGLDVGIDFEYHRFVFGFEYERGFINLFGNANNGIDIKVYNQAFYGTIGWKF